MAGSNRLDITTSVDDATGAAIVRLEGEASLGTIDHLQIAINRVAAGHPRFVVLDIERLGFMASLAMGAMVGLASGTRARDGMTLVAGPSPDVLHALQRSRLDTIMPVHPNVATALAVIAERASSRH